ncbi:MAG: DNA repair protein RecN, partial [Alistipes sp.]|nr:DNA repair protein RecN [Alistipes sp.]
LSAIVHGDEAMQRQREAIAELRAEARELAAKLHALRVKAAGDVSKSIVHTLAALGMPEARFEVEVTDAGELMPSGGDRIRFMFTANGRMAPQPVEKVASGGEISRVMLALKALLAVRSKLPAIIFDEIDTGVSGRIADAMGDIICALSATMQVIDITHLPQVASKGSTHMVVYESDGRTNVRRLSAKERIDEIAKMLSGSTITDAAREQACILLDNHQRLF